MFLFDSFRQTLMKKILIRTLLHHNTEEEAMQMFLWSLADIEPPVSYKEQLLFRALYRMFDSYYHAAIDSNEKALKALGIPRDKWCCGPKELQKLAKIAYWKQFKDVDMQCLMANAAELGLKKKAFMYLTGIKNN